MTLSVQVDDGDRADALGSAVPAKGKRAKSSAVSLRIDPDLAERIERARKALPYVLTLTAIYERGLVLACNEIEELAALSERATRAVPTKSES